MRWQLLDRIYFRLREGWTFWTKLGNSYIFSCGQLSSTSMSHTAAISEWNRWEKGAARSGSMRAKKYRRLPPTYWGWILRIFLFFCPTSAGKADGRAWKPRTRVRNTGMIFSFSHFFQLRAWRCSSIQFRPEKDIGWTPSKRYLWIQFLRMMLRFCFLSKRESWAQFQENPSVRIWQLHFH